MIVFDDLETSEKVKVYDKGIILDDAGRAASTSATSATAPATCGRRASTTSRRSRSRPQHFVDCIGTGETPLSDGQAGLRVVRILEAATSRWRARGLPIEIAPMREVQS